MKVRAWPLALAWVYTVLLLLALLVPVSGPPPPDIGVDKVIHLVIYGILALAWHAAWGPTRWRRILLVSLVLALGTEVMQKPLPWRSFDLWDMVANLVGVALALGWVWWPRRQSAVASQPSSGQAAVGVST